MRVSQSSLPEDTLCGSARRRPRSHGTVGCAAGQARSSLQPLGNPARDHARGNLTFILHGKRLKGRWHLVRLRGRPGDGKRENWLLIKGNDEYAEADGEAAIEKFQTSVVSRRGMEGKTHKRG